MPPQLDKDTYARLWRAHGGATAGIRPRRPNVAHTRDWRPGDPVHWQEQSRVERIRSIAIRVALFLQLSFTLAYLQYRGRRSIGMFPDSREAGWYALQIAFFAFEVFAWLFPIGHVVEVSNVVQRNCIDFKRIPNDMIAPRFTHAPEKDVPPEVCNYPSIDVVIPCYKEDAEMVITVVCAALALDYPPQLLSVYLCDDGRDDVKQAALENIQKKFRNLHYVRRPDNSCAKPGNVNYTLKRTNSDLVVQLDADFIVRPFLIQRLLPYFFVWNPDTRLYEFNDTLGFVQTPQHYRNLSPYDPDIFDQRNVTFFNLIQQGRDWFNVSTMVGTSNMLNRAAIREAGYFPYHSKGDDIALSVILHGLGYRSYHVTESVATGLVPPSLRGNLAQRKRWYTSDYEILFSKHGSLTQKGLTFVQRYVYFNIAAFRFLNILMMLVEILLVLVLVAGFFIVDVVDPVQFSIYLTLHLIGPQLTRFAECVGKLGVFKSMAANEIFEIVFRYSTFKGMFLSLFQSRMHWKTAEKTASSPTEPSDKTGQNRIGNKLKKAANEATDDTDENENGNSSTDDNNGDDSDRKDQAAMGTRSPTGNQSVAVNVTTSSGDDDDEIVARGEINQGNVEHDANLSAQPSNADVEDPKTHIQQSPTTETGYAEMPVFSAKYRRFVLRNLKRCWYNVLMAVVFTAALIYSLVRPPDFKRLLPDGDGFIQYNNIAATALAFGYVLTTLIPHIVVIVLCFKRRYLTGWVLQDVVNGRCDEFAERDGDPDNLFVPQSVVTYISLTRSIIVAGFLVYTIVATTTEGVVYLNE